MHYYLELTTQLDRVVVLSNDAGSYSQALTETGISQSGAGYGAGTGHRVYCLPDEVGNRVFIATGGWIIDYWR